MIKQLLARDVQMHCVSIDRNVQLAWYQLNKPTNAGQYGIKFVLDVLVIVIDYDAVFSSPHHCRPVEV